MEITNKTKLQELINFSWKLIEDCESFDVEKCPELAECQRELHQMETICMNYLLTKKE